MTPQALFKKPIPLAIAISLSMASYSTAANSEESVYSEQEWGLAGIFRSADVIYDNPSDDENVTTFIPMMFYRGEYAYINGLEGGVYLYQPEQDPWEISLFTRLRFIDIPAEYQNSIEGDTADLGLRFKYQATDNWYSAVEAMSDRDGKWYSSLHTRGSFANGDLAFEPHATLRYKSEGFNSRYYGLDGWVDENNQQIGTAIGSGTDLKVGINATYHVTSNLYLHGGLSALLLDKEAKSPEFIDQSVQGEYYLGVAFYNNKKEPLKKELSTKAYWRIAHGWGTPSSLGDIMYFDVEKDPYNSQLTSIFYGLPLTDELFGVPLDIYLTPGFVWHWSHEKQDTGQEYVLGVKAYYTIPWPVKWRFGVAEGISYANEINYLESYDFTEKKGYDNPSHLLNYLDFSFDVNLGDLFNTNDLNDVWLGYSVHHRSAIFEMSSQYGRLKGGSNYNTVYLQFDF